MALDPSTAQRLAKLCGMFGSNHDGERAAAAAKADALVRGLGLTWPQILLPKHESDSIEKLINFTLDHGDDVLTAWEEGFLRGIRGRQSLTEKQFIKLEQI